MRIHTGSSQLERALRIYIYEGFDALGAYIKEVLEGRPSGFDAGRYKALCCRVMKDANEIS